jgi:hypothetical protein
MEIEKIEIELSDDLCGFKFKSKGEIVKWEDLDRKQQIRILNSFAKGYELFNKFLKEE